MPREVPLQPPQGEDGAQIATDQPTTPKIVGGSGDGAEAMVTRLKNADLKQYGGKGKGG